MLSSNTVNDQRGFFLIEVMVTLAVLALCLQTMLSYTTNGANFVSSALRTSTAIRVGGSLAEELLSIDKADPLLVPGSHTRHFDIEGEVINQASMFAATWTVTPNTPMTGISEISIEITFWANPMAQKSIRLVTRRKA